MLCWILKIYYQYKIIKYFIKNKIINEENSININSLRNVFNNKINLDKSIDILKKNQILIEFDNGQYYLDYLVYSWRYKHRLIYYGEIILLVLFLLVAFQASHIKTTLFWK